LKHLEKRFLECVGEKHHNLLRSDIIQSIMSLHKAEKDDGLLMRAQTLIAKEQEPKYRKQYESMLKTN
jgi:hypothetical protein